MVHRYMVSLVDSMLALHKHLQKGRMPHDETTLQRQIEGHRSADRCTGTARFKG